MLTFIWLFLYGLKIPSIVFSVVALIGCAYVLLDSYHTINLTEFGSRSNSDARWNFSTAIQSAIIVAAACMLIQAIPPPTYEIKIVEKPIIHNVIQTKTVIKFVGGIQRITVPSSYDVVYKLCEDNIQGSKGAMTARLCHSQALQASDPRTKTITITHFEHDLYKNIYDGCMVYIESPNRTADAVEKCGARALEGSKDR